MPFTFTPTKELPDVVVVEPRAFGDERGWFAETYRRSQFAEGGIPIEFVQDNHVLSTRRGILRGMHYQKAPAQQAKLLRCVEGAILDVAFDLRKGSPTYGQAVGVELSADNRRMLYVPSGFAHGYLTLTDRTQVLYKVSADYNPTLERAVRWNDPSIAFPWPIAEPSLLPRDAEAPLLADADNDFVWEAPA